MLFRRRADVLRFYCNLCLWFDCAVNDGFATERDLKVWRAHLRLAHGWRPGDVPT